MLYARAFSLCVCVRACACVAAAAALIDGPLETLSPSIKGTLCPRALYSSRFRLSLERRGREKVRRKIRLFIGVLLMRLPVRGSSFFQPFQFALLSYN